LQALRCKVVENTGKTAGVWGKGFRNPTAVPNNKGVTTAHAALFDRAALVQAASLVVL